jgi:Flp pilus assembly protein TadD
LLASGKHDEAESLLAAATARGGDPRLALLRARVQEAMGKDADALETLRSCSREKPDFLPARLFHGIGALDAGMPGEAEAEFFRTLELEPQNELAASYRALALLHLGREPEARQIFSSRGFADNVGLLVRLTEWVETQWLEHGRFLHPSPQPDPAQVSPGGFLARVLRERRSLRHFFAKRYREVLAEMHWKAMTGKPDDEILFGCALAAEMLCDFERALKYIDRLGESAEMPDIILAARARSRMRLGRFSEAAADLNRVLIIGPEDYGVNYYLALLCLSHGERGRARALFTRAYRDYIIDTQEYQFWQISRAILEAGEEPGTFSPAP